MPIAGANILVCTVEWSSTVMVVKTKMPLVPTRSHTSTIAAASGTIDRTAVRVRTGTITTGNPVDATITGFLVSTIWCIDSPRAFAMSNRSSGASTEPRNSGFGCVITT